MTEKMKTGRWERLRGHVRFWFAKVAEGGGEGAFAPSVLEIQRRPPAPLARTILLTLMAAAVIGVLWSLLAEFDVVVTAPGKVVPSARVKVVQPLEAGIVKAIHVRDGQAVKAGQVLIELDPTATQADRNRLQREAMEARVEVQRLVAQSEGKTRIDGLPADADPLIVHTQELILQSRVAEYRRKMAALAHEVARKQADRVAADANATKLVTSLPMVEQRLKMKEELAQEGYVSRMALIESKLEFEGQKSDLVAQLARLKEAKAAAEMAVETRNQAEAEFKGKTLGELAEATKRLQSVSQELVKAEQRKQQQTLAAPVDGVVQQLAIHTVGGVATAAQPLLTVVPDGTSYEIEAQVLNKDIGFLRLEQEVAVKLDAFEYTKYGYLDGHIQWVGTDAIQDQKLGLVYPVRILVSGNQLPSEVNGRRPSIGAGMAVTADISVAKRRAYEYFLGPLLRYKTESLRER